jgi:uncharacterized protein (DUF302 family)
VDQNGLVTTKSNASVRATIDRLAAAVTSRGLQVFARIDHAAGAAEAGLELRPTELLIFGNPKGGTPLMQDVQTVGIDLPVKALAWEDADGTVWLTYNDTQWLADRHRLGARSEEAIRAIEHGMASVIASATG